MVALTGESAVRLNYLRRWLQGISPVLSGLGLVLLSCPPGWSHGAIATVTRTFAVEAHYSSGQPMASAQVVVYSPQNPNEPWTTGQTNEQGEFEFSPDTNGNWEVVVRQAGHGTTVSVPVVPLTQAAQIASADTSASLATIVSSSSEPLPLQRWAGAGAALWGLVGTALFFSRGKQS
ncbi:carboxypeptidase regulatory-like domain-containing protein [Leptolyngbya cf. ectocarpi LEGE 11479]|uniref:Carboxypeptidase regulatory-like domain-containing protein n=1 Tax=Leptolyngbya cf. ectocarpi LEGE 11479 TaxID=1828722 RepID=A0A928ZXB9_LEPEC|nr:carboxypeptidase-like regulatory domain-containing protein [Leptolyngbya ectocarpi]MBE9069227.1 carboxypeptidase regulatory-like domain-containing protein [Leptolyngbya cf. ectocarpi LEGE 11479]